jgi:hypothetical protein
VVCGFASSKVERFRYLYYEQHFVTALDEDMQVVKRLPRKFRTRACLQKHPVKIPSRLASVRYFLEEVLPALIAHGACGVLFSDAGGLQVCDSVLSANDFTCLALAFLYLQKICWTWHLSGTVWRF